MAIDLQSLESRLRALEDWRGVYEHEIRYAHLIDTGQTDRVAEDIFTADAAVDYGTGRLQGREAIRTFSSGSKGALLATPHNLGNSHIDVPGAPARTLCRPMAWHWHKTAQRDSKLPAAD